MSQLKEEKDHTETVPCLDSHPREWFAYWDEDESNTLERDELVRALVRTFCVNDSGEPLLQQACELRKVAQSLWNLMGFHEFDRVTFNAFIQPNGLCDQILHNWAQTMYFGDDDNLDEDD